MWRAHKQKNKKKPKNNKARAPEYRKRTRYLFWNDVMMEKKNIKERRTKHEENTG
jgi:hypothetical protein